MMLSRFIAEQVILAFWLMNIEAWDEWVLKSKNDICQIKKPQETRSWGVLFVRYEAWYCCLSVQCPHYKGLPLLQWVVDCYQIHLMDLPCIHQQTIRKVYFDRACCKILCYPWIIVDVKTFWRKNKLVAHKRKIMLLILLVSADVKQRYIIGEVRRVGGFHWDSKLHWYSYWRGRWQRYSLGQEWCTWVALCFVWSGFAYVNLIISFSVSLLA